MATVQVDHMALYRVLKHIHPFDLSQDAYSDYVSLMAAVERGRNKIGASHPLFARVLLVENRKVDAVKVARSLFNIGLKEAKDAVEQSQYFSIPSVEYIAAKIEDLRSLFVANNTGMGTTRGIQVQITTKKSGGKHKQKTVLTV